MIEIWKMKFLFL